MQRYQGRRRRGSFSRLIFLMVVLVIAAARRGLADPARRRRRGPRPARAARRDPDRRAGHHAARRRPAVEPDSLYSTASVRKALAEAPRRPRHDALVAPDSLSATGKSKIVYMSADGSITTVDSPTAIPGKAIKVDPAAPSRIARTIAKRTRARSRA